MTSWSRWVSAFVLTAAAGCATPATVAPADAQPETVSQPDAAPEQPSAPRDPDADRGEASERPSPWWTPLPPVSLDRLADHELAAAKACSEAHDPAAPDATAADLLAAADCLGQARAFGKEIAIYRRLLAVHEDAGEAADALRRLGERHEQLDDRPAAISAYADYLARYPARDDARVLGQRAVCLARSLDDAQTVDDLLSQLERLHGRRGFVVPPDAAFAQLCAGLPPVRR